MELTNAQNYITHRSLIQNFKSGNKCGKYRQKLIYDLSNLWLPSIFTNSLNYSESLLCQSVSK